MKKNNYRQILLGICLIALLIPSCQQEKDPSSDQLILNDKEYFETRGLSVLVFNSWYNGLFGDEKKSGIEIIHHGVRTVTNGDVRIDNTPEQWDEIPTFKEKVVDQENQSIEAFLGYPKYNFDYSIKVSTEGKDVIIQLNIDKAVPKELEGRVGLNLEFLPASYFEKSFIADGQVGTLPLYPSSNMEFDVNGKTTPKAIAAGQQITLAPEDPERRVTVDGNGTEIMLFDGRNKAQNGWLVLKSLIPSEKTGTVLEWTLKANTLENWVRKPIIAYSQAGYHPNQEKKAVIELDRNDQAAPFARLIQHLPNGEQKVAKETGLEEWGQYLRYDYVTFDFSSVQAPGVYSISYKGQETKSFVISEKHLSTAWHATNDIYFPVQMDHMFINEAYRVWHGQSHMDDALQAPTDITHFDLYAMGETTDTEYQPGQHIPGLNLGGWYDAGDYDIRTQTQYATVLTLVQAYEDFGIERDQTQIDQGISYVDLHHPDGKNDILQQIEHGTLALIAQYRAVGHAIPGIIVPSIAQYTHLGDGLTMTDNLIYDPSLDSLEVKGNKSGTFDDRWAFTSKSTALDYGSIATLAAASRVLKGHNDALAEECLETARQVWTTEHAREEPLIFRHGNTTGGRLENEELKAAIELYLTTKEEGYLNRIVELWPTIEASFNRSAAHIIKVLPDLGETEKAKLKKLAEGYKAWSDSLYQQNPYGVLITTGGWAGNGTIIQMGINNYALYKAFPDLFDKEDVLKSLNYLYGTHPESNLSFVSAVGTQSKKVAYGMNRADYSFIAGGVVPGTLVIPPDFPENKDDWPFLWGENEYVVNMGAIYIYLVHAGMDVLED
ncbi:glycoside hydrolase family 9 protein [Reichenbachiella ulvae]|uniref:Glycoside hydrolase family 9 protein n=1 Tax=Reichenbachiella ulvae TaxID=2980104 RepID=A0ABT3CTE7_9BACT|nr:glycoside hydrolase family 9 protein [Reichenbachiella ulvae]MCV9386967.1 glycoside hydrolase family 9 protein [Reichenbachiella ulvae]